MIGRYKIYESYINALRKRLDSLVHLYNTETEFPFQVRILGFPTTRFYDREELVRRIKELCEILHEPLPTIVIETEDYTKEVRIL